jgi:hypothetical protein
MVAKILGVEVLKGHVLKAYPDTKRDFSAACEAAPFQGLSRPLLKFAENLLRRAASWLFFRSALTGESPVTTQLSI